VFVYPDCTVSLRRDGHGSKANVFEVLSRSTKAAAPASAARAAATAPKGDQKQEVAEAVAEAVAVKQYALSASFETEQTVLQWCHENPNAPVARVTPRLFGKPIKTASVQALAVTPVAETTYFNLPFSLAAFVSGVEAVSVVLPYLHEERKMTHGDPSPKNMLWVAGSSPSEARCYINDFGSAVKIGDPVSEMTDVFAALALNPTVRSHSLLSCPCLPLTCGCRGLVSGRDSQRCQGRSCCAFILPCQLLPCTCCCS